ncbi:MAG: dephospho-CoA kinase [Vicinamibacterales bacterium]
MRVALTGGIATGKSVVAGLLRDRGFPVIDADRAARDVVAPGTPGLQEVVARFGRGVLRPDGGLDRQALGRLVFADGEARRVLEALLHPRVRAAIDGFFANLPAGAPGVAEIPLAYEAGWGARFDCVVVVACRPETQRARLMARDGLTAEEAEQRLAAQWPIADKVRLADAVVLTDGDLPSTVAQTERLARWLRGRSRPS